MRFGVCVAHLSICQLFSFCICHQLLSALLICYIVGARARSLSYRTNQSVEMVHAMCSIKYWNTLKLNIDKGFNQSLCNFHLIDMLRYVDTTIRPFPFLLPKHRFLQRYFNSFFSGAIHMFAVHRNRSGTSFFFFARVTICLSQRRQLKMSFDGEKNSCFE